LVRGTGMGLPIAKAIIAAQNGTISVTSQLGHGSVFSFTLPVARSVSKDSSTVDRASVDRAPAERAADDMKSKEAR
jgi:Histidine kinase-, DNA gyrase B-, and HSP90-like ATPase